MNINLQAGQNKLPTIKALGAAALINTLALNPFNKLEAQEVSFQRNQEINKVLAQDNKKARHYPNPKIQKYYQQQIKPIKNQYIKYQKSVQKLKANSNQNTNNIIALSRLSMNAKIELEILEILRDIGFEKVNKEPSSEQKKEMNKYIKVSKEGPASVFFIIIAASINKDRLQKALKCASHQLIQFRINPTISNAQEVTNLAQEAYQSLEIQRKYDKIIDDMQAN